jgi:hypothetical protein
MCTHTHTDACRKQESERAWEYADSLLIPSPADMTDAILRLGKRPPAHISQETFELALEVRVRGCVSMCLCQHASLCTRVSQLDASCTLWRETRLIMYKFWLRMHACLLCVYVCVCVCVRLCNFCICAIGILACAGCCVMNV